MVLVFAAFAALLTAGFPAPAQADAAGAQAFITKMTDNAVSFLGDPSLSNEERTASFRKLLGANYDMDTIGRFALGAYWKQATPAQRAEYSKLFKDMVVRVYSQRFKEYNGQKVEVRSARSADGNDTIVTSFIMPQQGDSIQVDWRVRGKGASYRVVDVIVQGVSMALTQRSDFASVIQSGGGNVEVLLDHLRKQNDGQVTSVTKTQ